MIAQLSGRISYRGERFVILAAGGIGWQVFISAETRKNLPAKNTRVKLWTHLAVREDVLELYGFTDRSELNFFEMLIGVPGVGPKSALTILGLAPPEILERAIAAGDAGYLTKVSGIGRKTAEKILLELGDKIAGGRGEPESLRQDHETLDALKSLGYSLAEARQALMGLPPEAKTLSEKIKAALKTIGRPA